MDVGEGPSLSVQVAIFAPAALIDVKAMLPVEPILCLREIIFMIKCPYCQLAAIFGAFKGKGEGSKWVSRPVK
jgi:hypothetical protein